MPLFLNPPDFPILIQLLYTEKERPEHFSFAVYRSPK